MGIDDFRFAAQFVTAKGKVLFFDSIECLAAHRVLHPDWQGQPWIRDFERDDWLEAERTYFIRSPVLRSPMGVNVAAFGGRQQFEVAYAYYHGAELHWPDLLRRVQATGFAHRPAFIP